jgi:hypothetical protein
MFFRAREICMAGKSHGGGQWGKGTHARSKSCCSNLKGFRLGGDTDPPLN